ncbi:hypothetical protein KSS87_015371, partial [Heliosperma pusillum]
MDQVSVTQICNTNVTLCLTSSQSVTSAIAVLQVALSLKCP